MVRLRGRREEMKFLILFKSGYEEEIDVDPEDLSYEYWVEFTERQNPYDAEDVPVSVDGVEMDNDGDWMYWVDERLGLDNGYVG
jgi:hypothetical protein